MTTETYKGCIGIDLGTTYSCVACMIDGDVKIIRNELGYTTTPSWVAFTKEERLIGDTAKSQASKNAKNTVFDVKRIIGQRFNEETVINDIQLFPFDVVDDINGLPIINVMYKEKTRSFKPEEISAMILCKMKEIAENFLGMRIDKAVITVPAYFNDSQRTATKTAASIAGLQCLRIINEPTAACLCYGIEHKKEGNILVFDLGGGTFDVSIVEVCDGSFEVRSTNGDTHLGGEDFDNLLVTHILNVFCSKLGGDSNEIKNGILQSKRKMRKLKSACEKAKCNLSSTSYVNIEIDSFYEDEDLDIKISRSQFERLCKTIFDRCMKPVKQVLQDAEMEKTDIDEIVLVGGSTRIPYIQELLSSYFDNKQLHKGINPDEAVAYGAAIQGAILTNSDSSGKTKDILLLDVIPLSLGIETKNGIMVKIIERNTTVPIQRNKIFTTSTDYQDSVEIKIFEGERSFTADNHKLAQFDLLDIPVAPKGVAKIKVTYSIDENGILTVTAEDKDTGCTNNVEVSGDSGRLDQEMINKMIDDAEEFKEDDKLRKDALLARERFDKFLDDLLQSFNNIDLTTDEDGNNLFSEEEYDKIIKYILNTRDWILDYDASNTREDIIASQEEVEKNLSKHISKLYTRKQQIKLKKAMDEKDSNAKVYTDEEIVKQRFENCS